MEGELRRVAAVVLEEETGLMACAATEGTLRE